MSKESKANATEQAHFPRREDISEEQKKKIEELRARVKDELALYPSYDTDFSLLRWLMGWDYDIEVIVPKLKAVLETMASLRIPDMPVMTPDEINAYPHKESNAAEHFPGGLMGYDRDGNMIVLEAMARVHPKTLCLAGPVSDLFRISVAFAESGQKLLRKHEEEQGRKLGAKMIMDLDGFSTDLLYKPTLKVYLNLLAILQQCFPDLVRKIYIINSPGMVHAAYALIQPVLAKQTRDKINFLGSDWKKVIIDELGAENIYPHWGGTKVPPNGKPTGDLRMGGKVSEAIWYKNVGNPFDNGEGFTKLNVKAGVYKQVTVKGKKGQKLRWLFRCESGDIDFNIVHKERLFWPKFRVTSEFVPDYGRVECLSDGEYTFTFDNSHGKLWSKDIIYKIVFED